MSTMKHMPRLLSEITSNGEAAFPWKLHRVLEEAEKFGFSDIVSWQGDFAFKVHHPKNFEKSIMKEYFNQTRYKSFQRQLNIYGFERITMGTDIGSYTHKLLIRGKPNICRFMIRTKVKNKGSKTVNASTSLTLSRSSSAKSTTTHRDSNSSGSISALRTSMELVAQQALRRSKSPRSTSYADGNTTRAAISNSTYIINKGKQHDKNAFLRRVSGEEGVISYSNQRPMGMSNETITIGDNKMQPIQTKRNFMDSCDMKNPSNDINPMNSHGLPTTIQFMSSTVEDDFSSDIFSSSVDNIFMNNNQELGNNSVRSVSTQASDHNMLHQQQQQQQENDPFSPSPIHESQPRQQQQQQQQQQIQEQQRQQECRRLQLQIQQLQNRIVLLNNQEQSNQALQQQQHHRRRSSTNSNYLCNGVAAIEPSDRGISITPPFLEINRQNSNNNNTIIMNNINHFSNNNNNCHLEKGSNDALLDPTPIITPIAPMDLVGSACQITGMGCAPNHMRRSISFTSFP